MVKKLGSIIVGWRIFLFIGYFVGLFFIHTVRLYSSAIHLELQIPYLIASSANFDGVHYITIAREGYHGFEYGFFPLYPLLIRLVVRVLHIPYIVGALFASLSAFFLSLLVIYEILKKDTLQKYSGYVFPLMFFFPTAFYYAAAYNDSLFLLLSCLTILFARKKNWLFACMYASFATLTRLNGLALIFFLLAEYLKNDKTISIKKIIKDKFYFIMLIPAILVGYFIFVQITTGSWQTVFSSMKPWGQDKIVLPFQVLWRYFKIIILYPSYEFIYWIAVIEIISVFLYLFFIWYSYNKIRFSYWIFFVISLLIPAFTGTFQGMPRYGLHLFPFFLSMAVFFEKRNKLFFYVFIIISGILLLLLEAFFTRGFFIA